MNKVLKLDQYIIRIKSIQYILFEENTNSINITIAFIDVVRSNPDSNVIKILNKPKELYDNILRFIRSSDIKSMVINNTILNIDSVFLVETIGEKTILHFNGRTVLDMVIDRDTYINLLKLMAQG